MTKNRKVHARQTMRQRNGRGVERGNWVVLNSGGPFMMVVDIIGDTALCSWDDGSPIPANQVFPIVCVH